MVFGHGMGQGWKCLSTGGPLVCLAKELIHLLGVWAAAPSRSSGWWVSPFQEGDWKALKHIREEQAGTRKLNSSGIAHADLDTWPVTHAITMSGYHFLSVKLHRQPIRWLTNRVLKIPPPAPWVATQIGGVHVRHPGNRHLSPWAPLCWGWNNHAIKMTNLIL